MMTWLEHHRESEKHAAAAEVATRRGDTAAAREFYALAAEAETRALDDVDPSKTRTLGVSAVSAVSLHYKARDFAAAEVLAHRWLASSNLPAFAVDQLRFLVESIWSEQTLERANVRLAGPHVLVSVSGGEVVRGGAPLDLIVEKVQTVQSYFYRAVELSRGLPHRKHGGPSQEILKKFRTWLFQAAAASYQFAVAVQEPSQQELFPEPASSAHEVAERFLAILRASVEAPEQDLPGLVPDESYRSTFLKLTRNLAPTGKTFGRLDVRGGDQARSITLLPGTREAITEVIRHSSVDQGQEAERVETIRGILRAVHLDKDWIEVAMGEEHQRISQLGEAQDDVIGPMVNKPVQVSIMRDNRGRCIFRDILIDE